MKLTRVTAAATILLYLLGTLWQPANAHSPGDIGSKPPDKPVLVSPPHLAGQRTLSPTLTVKAPSPASDLLTVTFYGRPVFDPENARDFNIVVLPDTQKYSAQEDGGKAEIFYAQTKWAVDNQVGMNIAYVSQVGDLTDNGDNGTLNEWMVAKYAMENLEIPLPGKPEGIPYGIAIGNHDEMKGTTFYNKYFGIKRFDGRSYYGGHYGADNNNHYEFFSAGGLDFIVLDLEFVPSPKVINWAREVINQYPLRRAIVVSHEILGTDGKFSGSGGAIYDMLKDSPNFFMMLCGHFHGASQRQDTDPGTGKTVFTLLADYQNLEAGGSGYLRVLNFSPSRNRIFVRTYSPYLKKWITSENNQFTLKYNMSENSFQVISSVSGVEPGASVSMEWPNLAEKRLYEWYATVTNPQGTSRGLTWRFTTDSRPIVNGEKYTMQWNSTLKIGAKGLLENDYYRGQGSLLTFVAKGPAHGKVELKPDGSFTYRPEAGYYGTDRFSYWVSSGVLYSRNVNVDITIRAKKENDPS